jgi:hypothetical protein
MIKPSAAPLCGQVHDVHDFGAKRGLLMRLIRPNPIIDQHIGSTPCR